MPTLSENIKFYRKQAKLTQKQLAERLGVAPTAVSAWELSRNKPLMDNVEQMAFIFNIKKSELLGESLNDIVTLLSTPKDEYIPNQKPLIPPSFNMDPGKIILVSNYDKLPKPKQDKLVAISEAMLSDKVTSISDKQATYDTRKRITLSVPGKVSAGTGYWQEDDYDTMVDFYADEIPDEKDYDTIAIVVGHSMEPKIKNGDFLFIKLQNQIDLNKIGIFQVSGENYVKKLKEDRLESLNKDYDDVDLSEDIRTIGKVVDVYREG